MTVWNEITSKQYRKLIKYALTKSDAFLLVSLKEPSVFKLKESVEKIKKLSPSLLQDPETIKKLTEKEQKGLWEKQIYTEYCVPFIKQIEPYLIKQRTNSIWPSTEVLSNPDCFIISVYTADPTVLSLLFKPNSYLSWRYPYYPEDLSFFSKNRCWLYASSHEGYIEVYPENIDEYNLLKNFGLNLSNKYVKTPIKSMFFESY